MIQSVVERIVEIGGRAVGIKNAFDPPPDNMVGGSLPALYAFTGGAQPNEQMGAKFIEVRRLFRVQVAVLPIAQGDPKTRETQCRPLLDAVIAAYWQHPRLGGLARVKSARVASDSGFVLLPEYGMKYIGFEVRVEVTTIEPRTITQGE